MGGAAEGVETRVSTEGRGATVARSVYPSVLVSRKAGPWTVSSLVSLPLLPAHLSDFAR